MKAELIIKDLYVSVEGKTILKGVNLKIKQGEIHALMGPNGSGKSTLSYALMGHPKYKIEKGDILFDGKSILTLSPDKKAKLGIFLGFQYPVAVPGVSLSNFLWTAYNSLKYGGKTESGVSRLQFQRMLEEKLKLLDMDASFAKRYLNEGFSGGEKKRAEILQMSTFEPRITVLDEPDSGLDIDALKIVAKGINKVVKNDVGLLLITHYKRILNYVKPDFIHIMIDGKIAISGGYDLAEQLEQKGYNWIEGEKNETNGTRSIQKGL